MKKGSVIQWFIRLIKRGMDEYEENEQEKQRLYEAIKKNIRD